MMGWVECDKKGEVGEILYWHNVVGEGYILYGVLGLIFHKNTGGCMLS